MSTKNHIKLTWISRAKRTLRLATDIVEDAKAGNWDNVEYLLEDLHSEATILIGSLEKQYAQRKGETR